MSEHTSETRPQATPERLQAALDEPCLARVRTAKDGVTAYLPELGLLARGKTVEAAHAELMRLREARIREYAAEGLLDELPRPGAGEDPAQARRLFPKLKIFLIKAAVVAALFLGAVNVISSGLRDTGYVLEKKLDAVSRWTPETVEFHREKAERIGQRLGPVLRALLAPAAPEAKEAEKPAAKNAANATTAGQ
jgi:hypothetical protein